MKKHAILVTLFFYFTRLCHAQNYASNWHALGPVKMPEYETSMGRVNCVAASTGQPNRLFIGTPGGGVWRSDDGGATWVPRTDFLPDLGVSSVVIDPANPNTIYMATGDADGADFYSIGVWKSVDNGTNWASTGLSWSLTNYRLIYKLAINPSNSQQIFAATTAGLYVTYNGGTNWQQNSQIGSAVCYDVQFQPGNTTNMFLACQGANYYRSTNLGTNWTHITTGLPTSGVDRSELGVTANNPQALYILYGNSSTGSFYGIYRSLDGGLTFNQQTATNMSNLMFDGQENYDLALTVSPTNYNDVFVAGNLIGSSTDGGVTWQTATYAGTHVDVHAVTVLNGALYACTDGGVHMTVNGGSSWTDLSTNLEIAQIYNVCGAPQNPALIYVGEQDDGLNQYSGGTWSHFLAGDFGQPVVDPMDQNTVYATAHGYYYKTTNSWASYDQLTITSSEGTGFEAPLAISPANHLTLYAGFENVWKTTNGGVNWFVISSFADANVCSKIIASPSDPAKIYAIRAGNLWRTMNNGANWVNLPLPSTGAAVALAISATDSNKVWLAQNDYVTANKVYVSSNGGTNWTAYTGSVPNQNVDSIVCEGGSNDGLYLGTDAGIYYRNASMSDWQTFNTNLPNTRVTDMQIEYASLSLRAATFGRGLWESLLAGAVYSTPIISGPLNPAVGQANNYSFTAVSKAISYQWLQWMELPFNLVDGAENGLVNFTATTGSGYSVFSSTEKASGNYSFHLVQPQPADQILTLNYTLLAQSNSAVQFSSMLGYATSSQVAEVQVSTNSGASWQNVFSEPGGVLESSFSTKQISLAGFAGDVVQIRFDYSYQGGGSYYAQTGDPFGWYLDNITFTNLQSLTNQIVTSVPSGTNFVFTPAQAGNYLLEARAVTYGPSYMSYGAPLLVTAGTVTSPALTFNASVGKLTLSWSDPTFGLQQTPSLSPATWTAVNSNSPAIIPLKSTGNMYYRLAK